MCQKPAIRFGQRALAIAPGNPFQFDAAGRKVHTPHAIHQPNRDVLERHELKPPFGLFVVVDWSRSSADRTQRTVALPRPQRELDVDSIGGPSNRPVDKRLVLFNAIQDRGQLHPAGSGGWRFLFAPPSFVDPPRDASHTCLNIRIFFLAAFSYSHSAKVRSVGPTQTNTISTH